MLKQYLLLILHLPLLAAFFPTSPITTTTTTRSTSLSKSSFVLQSKNSDRAHTERQLEDMMDNDWRVFRAKLVAQEQAEQQQQQQQRQGRNKKNTSSSHNNNSPSNNNSNSNHNNIQPDHYNDEKLVRQGQLGEIFAGAISSIFHKQRESNNNNNNNSNRRDNNRSIFDGDSIGGAAAAGVGPDDMSLLSSQTEDPFVSEEELPLLIKPAVTINKHRWAHEIPHVEPGSVLIANEKLGGVFHQTIVLVVQHSEQTGSIGIVINRYVCRGISCVVLCCVVLCCVVLCVVS